MRVENSLNHNSKSTNYSPKKKKKEQKNLKKKTNDEEILQLSDESKLLNKLVYATENQFTPIPFYFSNSAAKNVRLACEISKRIQNQALSIGLALNYTMIYEMVIDIATQRLNNSYQWKTNITTEYEILTYQEKKLLEDLHKICESENTTTNVIDETARQYIEFKTSSNTVPDKKKCAEIIVQFLKSSPLLTNNDIKKALSTRIKQYITPIPAVEIR